MNLRLSEEEAAALDQMRGSLTRSAYLRRPLHRPAPTGEVTIPTAERSGHHHQWVGAIGRKKCRECGATA